MDNNFTNEELNDVIVLNDEDGNDVEFEFLDLIEYEGEEYVVLLPLDEDADEVVILKVIPGEDEDDAQEYESIEDTDVLNAVFEIFKEKFKDEFNFAD
jgi:uncharacterized protein YrzB (UPF0473 family)